MNDCESSSSMYNVSPIVDADFHLTQAEKPLMPYLPDPWGELLTEESGDLTRDRTKFYPDIDSLGITPLTLNKVAPKFVQTTEHIKDGMIELGVDAAFVTPGRNIYLNHIHHDLLAVAVMQAYNKWLTSEPLDKNAVKNGIFGAIVVGTHRIQKSVAEIEKHADHPAIKGILIPGGGVDPALGHSTYWPIFEAAEDHGLPIILHNAAGDFIYQFPRQYQAFSRYSEVHTCSHPFVHMANMVSLLIQGVPERYPELNFVVQEAGLGWIPYWKKRIDLEYMALSEDAPMLTKAPSEYVEDNFYFTSQPIEGAADPEYLQNTIEMIGVENLMFSTDYPHFDFDETKSIVEQMGAILETSDLEKILGQNFIDLFGIEM